MDHPVSPSSPEGSGGKFDGYREKMVRALKPIEIAEGALLADIAVVYQLLVNYVPFIGAFFRFPIFIVFAILVLRRGLYVGIISGCVAAFIAGILMGPSLVVFFLIEMMGGLYLGVAMKYRFYHSALILLGATCGAFTFYGLFAITALITGLPVSTYTKFLQESYQRLMQLLGVLVQRIDGIVHLGLRNYWAHTLEPVATVVANWAIAYWWLTLFVLFWGFALVATTMIYALTNLVVRMLGYEVRPFPGRRFTKRVQRLRKSVLKLVGKRRMHAEA